MLAKNKQKINRYIVFILGGILATGVLAFGFYRVRNNSKEKIQSYLFTPTPVPTMTLKVYFNNLHLNKSQDCNRVYSTERSVPGTQAVAAAALRELFSGPSWEEKNKGYTSLFSEKTKDILKQVKIENGIAYVDLIDIRKIIPNASSSCGSAQFLAEIESTLLQFPSIKKAIIAIEEDPQTFYDWIQVGCSKENNNCDKGPFLKI